MAAKYGFDSLARRRMRRKRCSGSTSLICGSEITERRRDVAGSHGIVPDIYIERDFKAGVLNEQQAQE